MCTTQDHLWASPFFFHAWLSNTLIILASLFLFQFSPFLGQQVSCDSECWVFYWELVPLPWRGWRDPGILGSSAHSRLAPGAQWEPSAPSLCQKSAFLGAEGQEREAASLGHHFIICNHSIPAWWEGTYHVRFQAQVLLSALLGLNLHSSMIPLWMWASCVTSLPQLLSEKMVGTKWDNLVTRQSTRLGFQ